MIRFYRVWTLLPAISLPFITVLPAVAQDMAPLVESEDTRHFDYLAGDWYQVADGTIDSARTVFRIRRSVHPAAFVEEWVDGENVTATALRTWDKTAGRWMYVWVSGNGLFQVWEGRENPDGTWYIYRTFDIGGDRYLSTGLAPAAGRTRAPC